MILNKIKLFDARYGADIDDINDFLDSIDTLNVDVNFEIVNNSAIAVVKYQLEVDPLITKSNIYAGDTKLEVQKENEYKSKSDSGFQHTVTNGIPT